MQFSLTSQFDYSDLKNYVINLKEGKFAKDTLFTSSEQTVDDIVSNIIQEASEAGDAGLPVVLWAHGGLVSERNGLEEAMDLLKLFYPNGVYPLFFVWHSGLLETLGEILHSAGRAATRMRVPLEKNHLGDPVIEFLVHLMGGRGIWSAMKKSAELASKPDGGAFYVADQLAKRCTKPGINVKFHAVGHSGGSIFHSFLVPVALAAGVPRFETVQFLAPAITIDNFRSRLAPILGKEVGKFTMFTMWDSFEQNDNCLDIYQKSLLYLVHYACEHQRGTPLLGLQKCFWSGKSKNPIRQLFNIPDTPPPKPSEKPDSNSSKIAEVIWSKTKATSGDAACQALHHGDFDSDYDTLMSVVLRVLGDKSSSRLTLKMPSSARANALRDWNNQFDLPVEPLAGWPTEEMQEQALNALLADRKSLHS
jgi:hypothetical protein